MNACREYQGYLSSGYGVRYSKEHGRSVKVHRWVWEQVNGPIPDGMVIRHLCHNRACFLLEHLALGTQADNVQDDVQRGVHVNPVHRLDGDVCGRCGEPFRAYVDPRGRTRRVCSRSWRHGR